MQNPLFSGYAAVMAYLPSDKIAVAVAVTYDEAAFDAQGNYRNEAENLYHSVGALLGPHDPPPGLTR